MLWNLWSSALSSAASNLTSSSVFKQRFAKFPACHGSNRCCMDLAQNLIAANVWFYPIQIRPNSKPLLFEFPTCLREGNAVQNATSTVCATCLLPKLLRKSAYQANAIQRVWGCSSSKEELEGLTATWHNKTMVQYGPIWSNMVEWSQPMQN